MKSPHLGQKTPLSENNRLLHSAEAAQLTLATLLSPYYVMTAISSNIIGAGQGHSCGFDLPNLPHLPLIAFDYSADNEYQSTGWGGALCQTDALSRGSDNSLFDLCH